MGDTLGERISARRDAYHAAILATQTQPAGSSVQAERAQPAGPSIEDQIAALDARVSALENKTP